MRLIRPVATVLLLAGSLALSGCSGLVDAAGEAAKQAADAAAGQVADAAAGALSEAAAGLLGENVTIGSLPADWPAEVPVIAGEVSSAGSGDGWTALVRSNSASALAEATALLEGAGFTVQGELSQSGAGVVTLGNDRFQVTLTGTPEGVVYVVATAP